MARRMSDFGKRRDHRLNRQPVLGRRLDHGHIPQPDQRHVQRARNRRRRHREHVHVPAHLLQPFLVRHAEALLLIHDQQSQIVKMHVARKQPVRADENVHLPFFERRQ